MNIMKKNSGVVLERSENVFAKVDTDYALSQLFSSAGRTSKRSCLVSIELNKWVNEKGRSIEATADIYCHRPLTIRDETILYGILSLAQESGMLKTVSHDNNSVNAKKTREMLELSGAYALRKAGLITTNWTALHNHAYFKNDDSIGGNQAAKLKDTIRTLALTGVLIKDKINGIEHSTKLLSYHTNTKSGALVIGINPDFFSVLNKRNRYTEINTRKRLEIEGDFGKEVYRDLCARIKISGVKNVSNDIIREHGEVVIAENIIKKFCGEAITEKTISNNKTALRKMLDSIEWPYFSERGVDKFGKKVTKFFILRTTQV